MSRPSMPTNIVVNKVFSITKGARTAKFKIIKHPFFEDGYAVIGDHQMLCYNWPSDDKRHIIGCGADLNQAWQSAYDHT